MFDLRLSDEQVAIQQLARDFAMNEVRPVSLEMDRRAEGESRIPWEVLRKGSDLGFRTFSLSEENGGGGVSDNLTKCLVAEELAVGDIGVAYFFIMTSTHAREWFDFRMTPEQRDRFLPEFLDDPLYHTTNCRHEPDTDVGWDYFVDSIPGTGLKTKAVQSPDGSWIINGAKNFQTNGTVARLLLVHARTDDGPRAFLVPGDTHGITRREIPKIGRRVGSNAEIFFDDVRVPEGNMLADNVGPNPALRSGAIAALTLGIGRAAYEDAFRFTQERVQGGKPIIQHQAVGLFLADMAMSLEAARTLIWKTAWVSDHPEAQPAGAPPLELMATVFTADVVHRCTVQAMQLFGGMGIVVDTPVQKYVRDALIQLTTSFPFPSRLKLVEALAGYRQPRVNWPHASGRPTPDAGSKPS